MKSAIATRPAISTSTTYHTVSISSRSVHGRRIAHLSSSAHLDGVKRLEDAGASAIVCCTSLFEEQITEAQSGASVAWMPTMIRSLPRGSRRSDVEPNIRSEARRTPRASAARETDCRHPGHASLEWHDLRSVAQYRRPPAPGCRCGCTRSELLRGRY